jgi:hypothetical protein
MENKKINECFRLKIIEEINNVRNNPQEFAKKIRKYATFFKGKILKIPETIPIMTIEGSKAFEEAAFFLDNLDSLPKLTYSPGLTHAAHDALVAIQKLEDLDSLNNLEIDGFLNKHGQIVGHFAQAVDFGSSLPELVVINLLVDDGDENRPNRNNITDPKYKLIGLSTGTHQIYHNCTVLMFARHFYLVDEVPGDLSDENYESTKKKEIREINQKLNVCRRSSLDKEYNQTVENVKSSENKLSKNDNLFDDDFDLPEGCLRVEKQEKIVIENGIKKKIVKLIKHMEDGTIETDIFKEKV